MTFDKLKNRMRSLYIFLWRQPNSNYELLNYEFIKFKFVFYIFIYSLFIIEYFWLKNELFIFKLLTWFEFIKNNDDD